MKKSIVTAFLVSLLTIVAPTLAFAGAGTMGFYGGTSEGKRMPTTTDILLDPSLNGRRDITGTYNYAEMVFLSGIPSQFDGVLTVTQNGGITENNDIGSYTLTNMIAPGTATGDTIVNRQITFNVNYRRQNGQIIKTYEVSNWAETITTPEGDFVLDPAQSQFTISIIEDHNPAVVFYRGDLSMRAVYVGEGEGEDEDAFTTIESAGIIYGYDSPWSSTETHRIDTWVYGDNWQMSYQVRPTVSVTKTMQYYATSPTAISFAGNYREVMQNQSALVYDIFTVPQQFYFIPRNGSANVPTVNTFEQLIAPDTTFLRGHFAEEDIRRLFALQVITGNPNHFQPSQLMTRGEFVEALVKAIRLPLEDVPQNQRNNQVIRVVFPDVLDTRAEYSYIMAAFRSGLAYGRNNGNFDIDFPVPREEAIVILIRSLGLENIVPNPTPITVFTDSADISNWATREIQAAYTIGLISGDQNGNFRPRDNISKAEGAALINRLINYMSEDLVIDYSQRMINYIN